ncbi:MAG: DUF6531 domain-containing protein [Pyrinomonadaceae bacterium]
MFKRFITIITLFATSTLFMNGLTRANDLTPPPANLRPAKKKSCAPCQAASQGNTPADQLDKLATLGRRTQPLPFTPLQRSAFEGANVNMVSTATGHLAFAVTDLELNSGAMPITFQRTYASDRREDTGLGAGWSFVFDDRITLNADTALLTTGSGSALAFRRIGETQRFVLQIDEPLPHQSFDIADKDTIIERANGLTRTYTKLGEAYRLTRISDPNGNAITIRFDDRANVKQIASNSGATLALEWTDGKDARLLAVTDSTKRRITFKQDGQRLRAVTDAAGATWTYNYEGGKLTRAADPLNRTLLQLWYDKAGRVTEAGDAAGTSLYGYDSALNPISRRTVVTDQLGAAIVYEHTERGAVAAISNDEAQTVRFEYNAANRPVRITNSLGDETTFSFDSQNQLLRQTSSDGADKSFAYDDKGQITSTTEHGERTEFMRDERGNVIAVRSSDAAKSYRVELDSRGQTKTISSGRGRNVSLEHDAAGNKTAFAYSDVGRFETKRDAAGRTIAERLPSGLTYRNEFDARGLITKRSDNRGHSATVERDGSGAPVSYTRADGTQMRAVRDEAGRVTMLTGFDGITRRFGYDARGALTDYADGRGIRVKADYDEHGRLRSLTDGKGNKALIERDEHERILRIASSEGVRHTVAKDQPDAARFIKTSYGPTSSANARQTINIGDFYVSVLDSVYLAFFFGGSADNIWRDPSSLLDLLASPESGGGETREECISRHASACDQDFQAELKGGFIAGLVVLAGCTLATALLGAAVCTAIAVIVGDIAMSIAKNRGQACLLRAPDGCS